MTHRLRITGFGLFVLARGIAQVAPGIDWGIALGGPEDDYANCVVQTQDGSYFIAGETMSLGGDVLCNHGGDDVWVVKLDAMGAFLWSGCLGGSGSDAASSVVQTADGGYAVLGNTFSTDGDVTANHGAADIWLVKLDASGGIEWQRSYGGADEEYSGSIALTDDGGFVLTGNSGSADGDVSGNHGGQDVWVAKLDGTGGVEWQGSFGGTDNDHGFSVSQAADGGYLVAGSTVSNDGDVSGAHGGIDAWVFKLDANGDLQWQRALGGVLWDDARSMDPTDDGGCIVAGLAYSSDGDVSGAHGGSDAWVVKLDGSGAIEWQRALGGSMIDKACSVEQLDDGDYLVTAASASVDGDASGGQVGLYDFWFMKLDPTGDPIWQKKVGGSLPDQPFSGARTSDGGCIAAGASRSADGDVGENQGNDDWWIVKLDPDATGIDDHAAAPPSVFPNPATGVVHISLPEHPGAAFTLVDAKGTEVLGGRLTGTSASLDLTHLPKGSYILSTRAGKAVAGSQVILY